MHVTLIYTESDPWALGLRSVSAQLCRAGHATTKLFCSSEAHGFDRKTLDRVCEIVDGSRVVGFSCLARGSEKARQVIEALGPRKPFVVWGGVHATLDPSDAARSANVICRGEGEGFMVELLERLAHERDWRDLDNAVYVQDGDLVVNPPRGLIRDLDELPLFDFAHENEFHLSERGLRRPREVFDVREPIMFNGSRGCAFDCTYCSNKKLKAVYENKGPYVRRMTISRYVRSIRELLPLFPNAKYVYLIDEDFCARPVAELEEFAETYPREVGLPFECMSSPVVLNERKTELLVKAGLWRIRLGLESGSDRTKTEVYQRNMPNRIVRRTAEIIQRHRQVVLCYFMIVANPYEECEDLLETVDFLKHLPHPFYLQVYNLVFFPGTALYDRAIQDGLIDGKRHSGYELDYRSGLKYKSHPWKLKNLYLNGLLSLMEGKVNGYRLGFVPRCLLPWLLRPSVLTFGERHRLPMKMLIWSKIRFLQLRKLVARLVQRALGDPTSVYNLRHAVGSRLSRVVGR
ncbi:MAG TPA: radical SAM protein [Verrucomicrobiota bacterium]|nr:radical SAM protein [Verrucomicrobiota bacterium]